MDLLRTQLIKLILLFSVSFLLNACTEDKILIREYGSLSGTVIDSFDDQPLANVEINTNPSSSVVFSDSLGRFSINEIVVGEYAFNAQLIGYARAFVNASIAIQVSTEVTIRMDRTTAVPEAAYNPSPATGANQQSRNLTLTWNTTPLLNDSLIYDLHIFESNVDTAIFSLVDSPDTVAEVPGLRYETTYFWQVTTRSLSGGEAKSSLWNFTVLDFPDNRFVFTSNIDGNYQLHSSNDSSTQKIQITRTPYNSLSPMFSTDRKEIAYSANQDLDYHIFIMDYRGQNPKKVTSVPIAGFHSDGSEFCWWPDNGGFIYSHYNQLYSIDRHGANLKTIATAPSDMNFANSDYSQTTDKIVVQTVGVSKSAGELYLINADGTDMEQILDDLPGIIENPTFSIDGRQVMYTRDVSGFESEEGRQLDADIFLLNIRTGVSTNVSNNKPSGTNDLKPRFSPFGSEIIFTNVLNDGSGSPTIMVMGVDGSDRQILFENADMPNWK